MMLQPLHAAQSSFKVGTLTEPSRVASASMDLSSAESLSSRRRYQKVCIALSGQWMRVSTCAWRVRIRAGKAHTKK